METQSPLLWRLCAREMIQDRTGNIFGDAANLLLATESCRCARSDWLPGMQWRMFERRSIERGAESDQSPSKVSVTDTRTVRSVAQSNKSLFSVV